MDTHQELGDLEAAEREASRAVTLASAAPSVQVDAQGTLARVLLAKGSPKEARDAAAKAMELVEKVGQVDEGESLARLVDIETRRVTNGDAYAREAAARAYQRVMDRAATIEDPAWRKSFLGIRENQATLRVAEELGAVPGEPG